MIKLEQIEKTYEKHGQAVHALEDVNLHLPKGGFLAVTGPSGSGKTTLMNILGCLDRPDSGIYRLDGQTVDRLDGAQAADPPLILADEPTGNLDAVTGRGILSILDGLHREGRTIVMITHDPAVAAAAPRTLRMENGRLTTQNH